jgi:hypothetical protein
VWLQLLVTNKVCRNSVGGHGPLSTLQPQMLHDPDLSTCTALAGNPSSTAVVLTDSTHSPMSMYIHHTHKSLLLASFHAFMHLCNITVHDLALTCIRGQSHVRPQSMSLQSPHCSIVRRRGSSQHVYMMTEHNYQRHKRTCLSRQRKQCI